MLKKEREEEDALCMCVAYLCVYVNTPYLFIGEEKTKKEIIKWSIIIINFLARERERERIIHQSRNSLVIRDFFFLFLYEFVVVFPLIIKVWLA